MVGRRMIEVGFLAAVLPLAGCARDEGLFGPAGEGVAQEVLAELRCSVNLRGGGLVCELASPSASAGVSGAVLGGQGTYVELVSSRVGFDEGPGSSPPT